MSYGNVKYSLLIFDCSDWNKNYENELKYIWRKDLRTHTDFVMVALINFVWYWEKGSIHMSACWRGINSMKHHYWKTKNSTITWQKKILQMLIMNPQRKYEKTFKWKIYANILICFAKQYFTTSRCICKLLPEVCWDIWTWPNSIFLVSGLTW